MITRRFLLVRGGGLVATAGLAGCLSESGDGGEFRLDRVVFSDENPGEYDSYTDVPEVTTFVTGDHVWLLVAVRGAPTNDDGTAALAFTFRTVTPDGSTWDPVIEREEEWENVEETDSLLVWERFATYQEDPPGEYEMQITVEDAGGEQRLQQTETFELERGG
jgi:hypothetical protein